MTTQKKRYSFKHIVASNEIDDLNHVNNIHYLNWVQKAADKHWRILSDSLFIEQYVWVVLRHEIDYHHAVKLNDEVTITTWIGASYGVKSERFVEIKKGSRVVAKAKTIWCLLTKKSMRPIRIPNEIMRILNP